ncbi:hypothetical protein [Thermus caldifontis]|uniref:hypothetical protein n=1 Tax=Thermus caldifontis TaxID=1930763 RepID=UPI000DF1E4CA|nr:hypothetical protein [Thermus caldifontis]
MRYTLIAMALFLSAQAQVVLKTYYAEDLVQKPGLIEVSPGFTTVLDFWDQVDAAFSAKRELLRIEGGGPRLLLSAGLVGTATGAVPVKSGMTDLVVEVGGRTLLFTVRISPGEYPRRYQILLKRTQGGTYAPSREPSGPPPSSAPSSAPSTQAPSPSPLDVRFTTTVEAPTDASGKVSIFFSLENRGKNPVSFALNDLQVLQEGRPLAFSVRRDPLKAVLRPGEGQSGVIVVSGARPGELLLRWRGVELGPGRTFLLERSLLGKTLEIQSP